MARIHYYSFITNDEGQPIPQVSVSVLLAGTDTAARIFTHPSSGSSDNSDPQLTTNKLGYFEFWIGDTDETDGYENTQKFKIKWEKTGVTSGYIDYLDIFPLLYEIDETDSLSTVKNKIISNKLGYTWDQHARYDFSSSSPSATDVYNTTAHGLVPAVYNDNDNIYNKLVSNKFLQDNYASRDGSQYFTAPVRGENPINSTHLTTKSYVDTSILNAEVINSITSNVGGGGRSTIIGSDISDIANSFNSAIIASGGCEIDTVNQTIILISSNVISDTPYTLVMGYDTSGVPSTANKTIEMNARYGDIWIKNQLSCNNIILENNTGFPLSPTLGQIYFEGSVLYVYDGSWTTFVPTTTTVTAGNGLTGGGALSSNITLTVGTPGSITGTSTNAVTATSHTHELEAAVEVDKATTDWVFDGTYETVSILHNLNESYPSVTVWDTDTDKVVVMQDIESIDANTLTLYANTALNVKVKVIK